MQALTSVIGNKNLKPIAPVTNKKYRQNTDESNLLECDAVSTGK
jgi:hypothetical protein